MHDFSCLFNRHKEKGLPTAEKEEKLAAIRKKIELAWLQHEMFQ